jgi:pimeloyl-ACP methyl ester carboxylesterase
MRPIVTSLLYVARVVIFLHGVAGSRETYSWLPASVAGHRVIRPDFRGHGAAARTPGAYRLSDYVDDVLKVLRAEGPAILVGHSLGGVVAWTAAQQAPELVERVFMEDPPLYRGEHAGEVGHFRELLARTRAWQAAGISEAEAVAELAAEPDGAAQTEDALAARAYSLLHLDPEVLEVVVERRLLTGVDVTAPVDVPVFVLAAGAEPAFDAAGAERLALTHPGVEIVRVTGAGHSIHDGRAFRDEYFARVEAFVASHGEP